MRIVAGVDFYSEPVKDGGRSFGAGVPPRNGEMDCERKECRASFMP